MKTTTLIKKLEKKFSTIKCFDREGCGKSIIISAEDNSKDNSGFPLADYYDSAYLDPREERHQMGVSIELVEFLDSFGLFAEWENAGCLCVCLD